MIDFVIGKVLHRDTLARVNNISRHLSEHTSRIEQYQYLKGSSPTMPSSSPDISPPPLKRRRLSPSSPLKPQPSTASIPTTNPQATTNQTSLRIYSWNVSSITPFLPPQTTKITSFLTTPSPSKALSLNHNNPPSEHVSAAGNGPISSYCKKSKSRLQTPKPKLQLGEPSMRLWIRMMKVHISATHVSAYQGANTTPQALEGKRMACARSYGEMSKG